MSVLIRGMQMPLTCLQCMESGLRSTIKCAEWTKISAGVRQLQRAPFCPILEVPEKHGDLIDRDALNLRGKLKLIEEREMQIYGGVSWSFAWCIAAIEDAPTIIEAEGAEE